MMNKCTDQIWFVVELCESIKAVKMELANFELYSSVPHEFRVTMSNTYPPKEKDWALFGQFKAENDRSVQTFFAEGQGVFGKYARVEILSHHGEEHFCLVSHFKMFGVSEIELLGGDDDDDDDEEEPSLLSGSQEDSTFEEDLSASTDNPVPPPPPTKGNGLVSYLKEKVDETIGRFVGVFRPRRDDAELMSAALNETSLWGNTLAHGVACPGCDRDRYREVYFILASDFEQLRRALELPSLRRSVEEGVCQSLGFADIGSDLAVCSASLLSEFYRTLFGTSRTVALCNVVALEKRLLPRVTSPDYSNLAGSADGSSSCGSEGGGGGEPETLAANSTQASEESGGFSEGSVAPPRDANGERPTTPERGGEQAPDPASEKKGQEDTAGATADSDKDDPPTAPSLVPTEETGQQSGATPGKAPGEARPASVPRNRGNPASEMKEPPAVVHVTPSTADVSGSSTGAAGASSEGGGPSSPLPSSPTASNLPSLSSQSNTPWQKLSNKIKVRSIQFVSLRLHFISFFLAEI